LSYTRLTQREIIEAKLLTLAKEYSDVSAGYEARLLALQTQLERIESPRRSAPEVRPRMDAIDVIDTRAHPTEQHDAYELLDEPCTCAEDREAQARTAAQTLRLCKEMMRSIVTQQRCRKPTLYASACILALDDNGLTMRQVAKEQGCSPEYVSQLTERIRIEFRLPRNGNNKLPAHCVKYRALRIGKRKAKRT